MDWPADLVEGSAYSGFENAHPPYWLTDDYPPDP